MSIWRYTRLVWVRDGGNSLYLTDPETRDWISANLKRFFPSLKIVYKSDFSGEAYFCQIENVKDKGPEIHYWILKQLCLKGWEPFQISEETNTLRVHLRLEVRDRD
jgi:hypothetical protein